MKSFSLCFLLLWFLFPNSAFSMEEEVVFELKREIKKSQSQTKRKKTIPLRFKRKSFSYSEEFLIYNKKPSSSIKGRALRVNIPYLVIASFTEEFPVFGIVTYPFKGVLSGKIKALKNTNKASIIFDEIIVNGEKRATQSFPIFINGDLRESFFKDIAINFFESLPTLFGLALRSEAPGAGIHFINTDLQNKVGKLFSIETEKRKRLQYLELPSIKLLKVVIK